MSIVNFALPHRFQTRARLAERGIPSA